MDPNSRQQQIVDILNQQIQSADRFKELLTRERETLEGRDLQGFEQLIDEKQKLVSILEKLERERSAQISGAGYNGAPEDFEEYLKAEDKAGRLAALADRLSALLSDCFQMNRINGGIAELSYHYLNQSLAILRGTEPHQKNTYGPQGKPVDSGDSQRSIAKV